MRPPLVSVATITYNHDKFIADCIESVVTQKTDFEFEMIIGEDCSTDRTREIIKSYEKKYPGIIRPLYNEENYGKKYGSGGGRENLINVIKHCNGKYIAILDGDDLMLPGKLQKQVEMLENDGNIVTSIHNVELFCQNRVFGTFTQNINRNIMPEKGTLKELIRRGMYFANTSSMFRTNCLDISEFEYNHKETHGDWYIHMLLARNGNIGYINEVLGKYRTCGLGISTRAKKSGIDKLLKIKIDIIEKAKYFSVEDIDINYGKSRIYLEFAIQALRDKKFKKFNEYIKLSYTYYDGISTRQVILFYLRSIDILLYYMLMVKQKYSLLKHVQEKTIQ